MNTRSIAFAVSFCSALSVTAKDDPPPANAAAALVRQLGSSSFQARESAERQLKALGLAALPAVVAGTSSAEKEIAERCKRIQHDIRAAEAEAFIAGKKDFPSAAWKPFKELVGDSPESRKLFADMMADERRAAALDAAEANPQKARDKYATLMDRASQLCERYFDRIKGQPIGDGTNKTAETAFREAIPPEEIASVLFLGRHPIPAGETDPRCCLWLFTSGFAEAIDGPAGKEHRKLFAAWSAPRRDPKAIKVLLAATLNFALKEGVPTARRLLDDKNSMPWVVDQCLLVIGHHGSRDDLPLVKRFRDDDGLGSFLIRDFAAAMALQLSGQDFEKFGYTSDTYANWIRNEKAPYRSPSRLQSAEERAAAAKKAWEWLDAHPKGDAVPPTSP